jgi:hypothetical protein
MSKKATVKMRALMKKDTILLGLTGDVMIGRLVNEYLDTHKPSSIWGNVLSLLKSPDFNLINLVLCKISFV